MSDIIFPRTVNFLGRNGFFKAKGVNVTLGQTTASPGAVVNLYPITTKDREARCLIEIPVESLMDFISALPIEKLKLAVKLSEEKQ